MDLSVPIIAIFGFLGYKLNEAGRTPRKVNVRDTIPQEERPSATDIYNSKFSRKIQADEQIRVRNNFEKSRNPRETNVISRNYPVTQCQWDCAKPGSEIIANGPMFREGSTIEESITTNVSPKQPYNVRTGKVSELTGLKIDKFHSDLTAPQFGSSVKQNTNPNANLSILEHFSGNIKNKQEKNEELQFFEPTPQNTTGSAPFTDYIDQSYFTTSVYKNGENPFPKIMVTPIPAEDNRPVYKTIDELRVKPKYSYSLPAIQGQNETRISNIGKLTKKRPPKYFTQDFERANVSNNNSNGSFVIQQQYNTKRNNRNETGYSGVVSGTQLYGPQDADTKYIVKEQQRETSNSDYIAPGYNPNYGVRQQDGFTMKETYRQHTLYERMNNPVYANRNVADSIIQEETKISNKDLLLDRTEYAPQGQREVLIADTSMINLAEESNKTGGTCFYTPNPNVSNFSLFNDNRLGKVETTTNRDILDKEYSIDPSIYVNNNPYNIKYGG